MSSEGNIVIMVDKQSRIPIYEQIIDCIERDILNGLISENELIPSVRALSIELSINPNTIQKAYSELERCGITYSVPGLGRYVSKKAADIIKEKRINSEGLLVQAVENLKLAGMTLEEITEKVRQIYIGKIGKNKNSRP